MQRRIWLFVAATFIATVVQAQEDKSGLINFNIGKPPVDNYSPQPVTLFGCNNTIFKSEISWDTPNQVIGNIPYGHRESKLKKSKKPYFISKYYVASPPSYPVGKNKNFGYLGLVTPDHFVFQGDRPAQIVNLDYRILESTYFGNIPVDFNYPKGPTSCKGRGVTSIPLNIECKNLPWKNGAKGGSGIAHLKWDKDGSSTFLPFLDKNKKHPLQCSATLLDDVMLDHEVYFSFDNIQTKTVNLANEYKRLHGTKQEIKLICVPRGPLDIPKGCAPPAQ